MADDVVRFVDCDDKDELKQLLLETTTNAWLKPAEVSYTLAPATGQIPLLGGLTVEKILARGHAVLGDHLLVGSDLGDETLGRVLTRVGNIILQNQYCVPSGEDICFENTDKQHSIHDVNA